MYVADNYATKDHTHPSTGSGGHVHLDYANAVSMGFSKSGDSYTAKEDGFMLGFFNAGYEATDGVFIEGKCVLRDDGDGNGQCGLAPMSKGDVCSIVASGYSSSKVDVKFVPYSD